LIIDVVIGFNQTLYEVSENERQALISVTLLNGTLQREATVTVSITENTAIGMKII
jgi:transposase